MVQARMSFIWLVVLALLGLVCGNRFDQLDQYGEHGENYPYIFKKDNHERRLATEYGEIRAVPIFREGNRLSRILETMELNIISIKANAFMLPHFTPADRLLYVREGRARVGFVCRGRLVEKDLESGTLYFIPKGSLFYAINNDNSQTLVFVSLLYNPDPYRQRHHDSFYVGGGQNPPSLLRAFSREVLEASFKTESERIQRVISKQDRGVFVPFNRERMVGDDNMSPFWQWRSKYDESREEQYEPMHLQRKRPTFSNNNGQFIEVDREDFPPLDSREDRQAMGVVYCRLEPGKMAAPHWNTHAVKISLVLRGRGRIEIAAPEGVTQQQREGGESESEREREREREAQREGDFRLSYTRVESDLQPEDVFVLPADTPSVEMSTSNERFEVLSFVLNNERNNINFLAGKNSVMTQMNEELLAASFNVDRTEDVRMLTKSQNDEFFLDGPRSGRRDHSVV